MTSSSAAAVNARVPVSTSTPGTWLLEGAWSGVLSTPRGRASVGKRARWLPREGGWPAGAAGPGPSVCADALPPGGLVRQQLSSNPGNTLLGSSAGRIGLGGR